MTLDANLRRARKRHGWSRKEAANRAGVHPNALYLYETGRQRPSQLALLGLAALYGCSTDWLLSDHDPERDDALPETLAGSETLALPETLAGSDAFALRPTGEIGLESRPVLGFVSAGELVESWSESDGQQPLPDTILRKAPGAFALRVSGNSLLREGISDGDTLIVDPDPDLPFVEGRIYVVRSAAHHQTIAARRVYLAGPDRLKLVTGDGQITEVNRDEVDFLGRVRWSFREH